MFAQKKNSALFQFFSNVRTRQAHPPSWKFDRLQRKLFPLFLCFPDSVSGKHLYRLPTALTPSNSCVFCDSSIIHVSRKEFSFLFRSSRSACRYPSDITFSSNFLFPFLHISIPLCFHHFFQIQFFSKSSTSSPEILSSSSLILEKSAAEDLPVLRLTNSSCVPS